MDGRLVKEKGEREGYSGQALAVSRCFVVEVVGFPTYML